MSGTPLRLATSPTQQSPVRVGGGLHLDDSNKHGSVV